MKQDIYYSDKKIHKAIRVTPLDEYILNIEYEDGTKINFDMTKLLNHPLFKPLKDKEIFNNVWINGSAICWPNDIDLCSDSLYPS
jgi:hypothetical protein